MLPLLKYGQKVFVEITNQLHGGIGWELGTCLWSPVYDKGGAKAWKIMERVNPDDIIIHLVDIENEYHWYGLSKAASYLFQIDHQPSDPGKWEDMLPYQRVNLNSFIGLDEPISIKDFFKRYEENLKNLKLETEENSFYVEYNDELRIAQRYAAICPIGLYELFDHFSNDIGFNPIFDLDSPVWTIHERPYSDYDAPQKAQTIITRIIRDTSMVREIKEKYHWRCIICGMAIQLPNGELYNEGHHLRPLGSGHDGPDIVENIIIVCPNHHTEFDQGSIAIDPGNGLIEHINHNDLFHGRTLAYLRGDIGREFIEYHYKVIFGK